MTLVCLPELEEKVIGRLLYHALFWPRLRANWSIRRFARSFDSGRVLEIGSGRPKEGRYPYSAARFFTRCDVVRSDIIPEYGHLVVDVATMDFDREFDGVLCVSVLEHVYEFRAALENIHRALRPGGRCLLMVPAMFPLHDEPADYWRFTEHAVRRMTESFSSVVIIPRGPRRFPIGYEVTLER